MDQGDKAFWQSVFFKAFEAQPSVETAVRCADAALKCGQARNDPCVPAQQALKP